MQNTIQQSQAGKNTRGVFCLRLVVGFLIYLLGGFPTLVFALPTGGQVVAGDGTIEQTSATEMEITQNSEKLIADFDTFDIWQNETVDVFQPGASSVALFNTSQQSPSQILGALNANGNVWISNGSGVVFGQGAQVNVGGLLATTLSITNENFLSGNYVFTQDPTRPLSSVINRGLIEASYVGLLAPGVENTGTITANLGSVAMASGKAASLDFVGDGLINFAITEAVDGDVLDDQGNVVGHRVKNSGLIQADGGRVVLSARDAGNIIQDVVNNEGIIQAHSAVERNGEIYLMGGDSGVVANSGTLDASGKDSGETGGTVHMVGEKVGIFGEGVVDVSGNAGGGTALIGGDVQGGGGVQTATNAYVSEDAVITADAIENGDGGKVVVWADDTARIYGSVSATGGSLSGNGGFVETSGGNYLQVTRAADVTAAFGLGGEWLIDPRDISIEAGNGNTNINSSNPFVSTGDSSILGVGLIIAALTGGANVTITTGSDGAQAGDITLNTDLDYNGTGTNTLSFIAHNDIILNNSILDSSAGGDTLNLVFTADSDLSGSGTLVVGAAASVESEGGSMQVTARDVDIQGTMDAGAGDITIAMAGVGQIQLGDAAFCPTCAMVITGLELQNITASNLTVENSSDDIYVDSITAANSDNIGTVILDAGGNVEMGRNSDEQIAPINSSVFNALTVEADGEIFIREDIETDTGDLTLTADTDSSGGVDDWITFRSAPVVVSAGDITLNGSSSSTVGIRTVSFGVLDLTSAGTITFNDDFSGTSFANVSADNGIIINADFISNAIDLDGNANGSADGIDQIVFADGITVSAFGNSAKAIIRDAEALGSITITAGSGIDFLGDFTANGAVNIDADTATNVSTGTFTVASGKTFTTNNNTLTINASDVDFQGLVNAGAADVTLTMALANGQIALGDSTLCPTCTMKLSGSELQNITASTLTIGSVDERILVDNISAANSNNIGSITLNSGKHIIFQGNASTFNTLTASATDDMDVRVDVTTDTGDLIMTGDSDLSGGNRFKIFNDSVLTSGGDMTLTHSGSGGTIEVTSIATMTAGGSITLASNLTAGFHANLSANDGITVNGDFTAWGTIDLDGDANGIGGDSVTFASGTTLRSTNRGIILNRFDALGGITVLAANGIDINGAFSSAGATVFNADSDGNSTGNFNVNATGSVATNNNTLTINAFDVDLQGAVDAGALGDIVLSNASGKIQLGDSTLCPTCTMQISGAELQNITAGTLTVNSTDDAILVDNVTDVNSNNVGTVILNSAKHIAFQGNASTFNALTANGTTDVDVRVSLTTDTGDLILNGDSDSSGGADRLKIFSGSVLTSAGDIVLTHSGGAGTIDVSDAATFLTTGSIDINGGMDVGTLAVLTAGGSIDVSGVLDVFGSMTMTSGGTITLDDVFTSGATATFNADNGINVNGDFTASGNVVLNGDANASVDGNDTITFADGITVESTSGSVTFNSAASALGIITVLAANGIDINGAFTSAGTTNFNADKDNNSTGDFNVGATGSVATNNNTLTINAVDVDLQGTLNAGVLGDIILSNASGKIQLGDNTLCPTCTMQISGSELQNITAGTLTINSADDAVFIDNISAANSNNVGTVVLDSAKHIAFQGNASTFNALTASATTDIDVRVSLTTDTGDLILNGDSDLSGGADRLKIFSGATLTSAGDIVLTHSGGAGTIDVSDAATFLATGSIDINGGMDVGTLAVLTAGGSIDVSGVLDVFGSMTMTSGGTITLDDVFTSGATATFNADNGINVNGDFTASGSVILNGDANASVDGNDTITFADGITVESTSGSVTFNSAASALGVITIFAANGINVNGAFSSAGATEFNADKDGNSTGNFNVGASGSVATNNNTLTINAFDLDLQGTLNAGALGNIILTNASGKIALGDSALCGSCVMLISGAELENITAGTLTITNSDDAIFIDNVTSANSNNIGMVILNSAKHMVFQGNASRFNALTANATTDMDIRVDLRTDSGDLILTADTDLSGGPDRFKIFTGAELRSEGDMILTLTGGAGTIDVVDAATMTAVTGSIDINGNMSVGGLSLMTAGGSITFDGTFTSGSTANIDADNGINVNGDFTADGSISMNGDANSSVDGNDTITLANGITIESTSSAGSLNLTETSALGSITILSKGSISLTHGFTSNGATVFNADSDANGTGTFSVTGSVNTNNNTLDITADDIALSGTINAGLSDITILVSDNGTVGLGSAIGDMTIDGAELQNITAGNLIIGNTSNGGDITVGSISAANSDNAGTVTLNSGGSVTFFGNSVFNTLNVNAVDDINVNPSANLETDVGDFIAVADFDGNNSGDFNLGTGSTVTSANDIDITGENVVLDGNLVAAGTITINGVVSTGGGIFISAADGIIITNDVINNGEITIDADTDRNGVGDFEIVAGKTIFSFGNDISITANDFIIDGTINAGTGKLTLLSSVAGSTIVLGFGTGDIVLSKTELQNLTAGSLIIGSTLNSGVVVDGVKVADLNNIANEIILSSGGSVDFTGGTSNFGNQDLLIANSTSINVNTALDTLGFFRFESSGDININADLTSNNLNGELVSGGSIVTTGASIKSLLGGGALDVSAVTGIDISTEITSLNFSNSGSGNVVISNLGGLGPLSISGSNSGGNLSVTTDDDLNQSAALTISGTTTIATGGHDVTLTDAGNDFTGTVSIEGVNVSLVDSNAVDLGASTVLGTLSVTAGGAVTDSGALDVVGATTVTAAGFDVTLDDAANDFNGTVNITGANVTLVDSDDITLGASTVTGDLTVSAANGVTIDGAVTTSGVTSIDADSDSNSNGNFTITATGSVLTNDNTFIINARDVDLQGTLNAGLGDVVLGISGLGQIQLGDSTLCPTCPMQISGTELQNITAGSLTINNSSDAIFVDNITAANSDNIGTVILNSGKHLVFQGNASTFNALTANATTDMDVKVGVTTDTGDLILTGDSDLSGGPDRFKVFGDQLLASAGDLTLTHSGSAGLLDFSGSALLTSGGTITLGGNLTSGFQVIVNADDGINVNGDVTAFGDIILNGDANGSADGNDTVILADGITLESTTRTVVFDSATSALGAVTVLATDGIDVNGAFTSNGTTVFNADSNGSGFGTIDILGSITTNNNTLSIIANDLNLVGTLDAGTSDITILISDGGSIGLGNAVSDMTITGSELQNITAANLIIGDTSGNFNLTVDGVTDANSDNIGTVTLNASAQVRFEGAGSTFNSLAANASADVIILTDLTTDVGDMVLTADIDSAGAEGTDVLFIDDGVALSSAGDMVLSASASITDRDIIIDDGATLFATGELTFNNEVVITGNVSMTGVGGINVNHGFRGGSSGDAIFNSNGNINVAEDVTVQGDLTFTGTGTANFADGATISSEFGSVSLNDVSGAGVLTFNAANGITLNGAMGTSGDTTINADTDANGIGTFTVNSAGSVNTNNNDLSITADDIDLQGTINVGASDIAILVSDGGTIGVGTFPGDMTISGAELQNITTNGTLTIGDGTSGDVTVRAVSVLDTNNINRVSLNSGGSVTFSGGFSRFRTLSVDQSTTVNVNTVVFTDTGAIDLTSSGDININADLNSAATSTLNAGGSINNGGGIITATNLTATAVTGVDVSTQVDSLNVFNTGVGDILVNNSGALTLGSATNLGGSLNVATTGTMTLNGNVTADGDVTLAAQDAGGTEDVLHISGTVTSTNGNIDISADDSVDLENIPLSATNGSVTITGTNGSVALDSIVAGSGLTINSGGAVTQIDAFTITGTTDINAAGQDVILNHALNDFIGSVSVAGANITLNDSNNILLDGLAASGDLNVTAVGSISDAGVVTVAGTTNLDGQIITLDNASNDFMGAVNANGTNVTLVDANAIDLGTIDTPFLFVKAGGNVTNSGALTVSSVTEISAAGFDVTLDNAGNDFGNAITVTGANVTLFDINDIRLGLTSIKFANGPITGNLTVTANGSIQNHNTLQPLTVFGTTTFTAGTNVSMSFAENDFMGQVNVTAGGAVSLKDVNGIDLGDITTSQLIVTAGGAVTDSGTLDVAGTTSIFAAGHDVILDSAGNDFTNTVSVEGANVAITDVNDLVLGASTVTGTYTLNSGGSITQAGALNIAGDARMHAAQDIILTNAGNDFSAISFTGNDVSLVDVNGIVLSGAVQGTSPFTIFVDSVATGNLSVTAGGDVTQSGILDVAGTTDIDAAGFDVYLGLSFNKLAGAISINGHNVHVGTIVSDVILGASTITGDYTLQVFGDVTQTGALNIAGKTILQASNITLDHASNDFQGTVSTFPGSNILGNVSLTDINSIDFGFFDIDGNLSVTAGGAVTQTDALTIAGTTDVNAAGYSVSLNNVANDFGGAVSVTGNFVSLFDANDLELGTLTTTSDTIIIANGNLTQSGTLNAQGFVTLSAQDITLMDAANDFQSRVKVTGNNVSLADANAIEFGDSTINGDFMLTAGGDVTQVVTPPPGPPVIIIGGPGLPSGATLTVAGTTMINAIGHDVTLNNDTNDFGGEVGVNAGTVKLADINSITLKDSTMTGDLRVDSNDGITINGTVSTGASSTPFGPGAIFNSDYDANGTGTFSVTAAGSVVTADNSISITADDIDLDGTLNAGTSSVRIRISDAGTIGLGNATGDLTLDGSELENITAGHMSLGNLASLFPIFMPPNNGDITVDGVTALNIQNIGSMALSTGGDINFVNNDSFFNSLVAKAANDININTNVETSSGIFLAIADSDANGSGTFTVAASKTVFTNDHALSVVASDIDLMGTLNSGNADTGIWISNGGTIGLGNTAGDMTLDGSELQNITAVNLFLGSTSNSIVNSLASFVVSGSGLLPGFVTGDITVDGITAANSQNIGTVTLASGGNIHFENNDSVFNALNVHAVTDINVNTNLETDTGSFEAIADFELNNIGDFNLASGTTVTSAVDIDITAENVNLNGNLNAGGTITINGEIFADDPIFLYAVDGIIITEDINNNEAITIDADTNRDGIGDFELVGGVLIKSNGYDISITANDFIINGTIDAGTGNVILLSSVGGSIGIGEASGDIEIDNSELQNITAGNLNIGDATNGHIRVKNVQAVDVANIAKMTLNATQAGKSVYFYGPASNLNDLTVNAANDVRVYGGLTANDTIFNAGDDVKLWGGTFTFDSLTAVADDDIIIYGTLNTVNADYTAGDDIWLDGYQTYTGNLNATAGDDITIDWELTAATATLNAGDDVRIYGTTHFGDLTVNAGDDISVKGNHVTTGTANLSAVDDISLRDSFNINFLNASAGDDIHLHGSGTGFSFNLAAGDDVYVHGNYSTDFFTVNAGDDVHMHGTNSTGALAINAGDDISIKGNTIATLANLTAGDLISLRDSITSDFLNATAGNNISVYGTVNVHSANFTATAGDVRLDGYQTYQTLNVTAGDDISIGWELNATTATLNAGDDVSIKGTTRFGDLTVTAADDISIRGDQQTTGTANLNAGDYISLRDNNSFGTLDAQAGNDIYSNGILTITNDANLNAGDDIHLHGNNSIGGELNAQAVDDIHLHGLLTVTGDGNLDAGDDIHLHGNNSFGGDLNADAGDDIHSHGLLAVGNDGSLVAGDDISLKGNNSFGGSLFAAANGDIRSQGDLAVTGSSFMSAGNDIYMNGQFNSGAWTAIAGDDIRLRGDYNLSTADLKANDEIRIDRATINSGDFSAEADFDNNGSGAFKLEKHSSISSTGDIDLSGYGLKIKGSLSATGTINLTDKSE